MNMSKKVKSLLYQPLSPDGSFRLLKLTPSPSGDSWEGILAEHRLCADEYSPDATKYVALSYAWGYPMLKIGNEEAIVGPLSRSPHEEAIEVPLSLSVALGSILQCSIVGQGALNDILNDIAGPGTLNIWVDQFCINQQDKRDKEQQVPLMGRVYAGAEQVIGWLGPGFEGSDEALDDLILFAGPEEGDDKTSKEEFWRIFDLRFGKPFSNEALFQHYGSAMVLGSAVRRRVLRLLSLPWFHRRWIAQEACLASNLRVWCGQRSVSGEQLFRAIKVIQSVISSVVSPWIHRPLRNAYALLRTRQMVRFALEGSGHISYPHMAATLSFLKCSEDKDRINALFGIVEANTSWFSPTYDKNVDGPELYITFAIEHMRHFRSFEVLHFAGVADPMRHKYEDAKLQLAGPERDLPSWVADWRI